VTIDVSEVPDGACTPAWSRGHNRPGTPLPTCHRRHPGDV